MAQVSSVDFARKLIQSKRLLDAAHVLEATLVIKDNDETRLLLSQIYIGLKENNYRRRARFHLEHIVESSSSEEILRASVRLLANNVYLTNGPVENVGPLVEKHRKLFSDNDLAAIQGKAAEIDQYLRSAASPHRRSTTPAHVSDVENSDLALKAFIFNEFKTQISDRDISGSYFTFGSCFAGNVARAMKAGGVSVDSFWVGEEVNTTFSNVNLLRFILGEDVEHRDYYANVLAGHDVERLRTSLLSADNVIYTLGVALAFFDGDRKYIPHTPSNLRSILKQKDMAYRFSSVDENLGELEKMRDLLARHTSVRNVFLTVSPVPLAASLMSSSASVDDSESKAILRAAAGVMCRNNPETFIYFPSFEAFRWLPCFQDRAAFGGDDGALRHPNGDMVDDVVSVFMQTADPRGPDAVAPGQDSARPA